MGALTITKITVTKKGRYALFCDEEFLFSVEQDVLIDNKIEVGTRLDEFSISEIQKQSFETKAVNKALRLVGIRNHSKKELVKKLSIDYDLETAKKAVQRVEEFGYLDETEFVERCIETVFNQKFFSNGFAKSYLLEKGIDHNDYPDIIEPFFDAENERLFRLIEKKRYTELTSKKQYESAKSFLYRKGFPINLIKQQLEQFYNEQNEQEEFYE